MEDIVAASDRIYRLIVHVYPRAFRDEYGEEMAQTIAIRCAMPGPNVALSE